MPTYMDRHDGVTVTPEELAQAHALDVEVQAKHGVNYLSYWYDRDAESVFCFVDAPSKEAAEAVHREAHGLVASKIIEVEGQAVMNFLGPVAVASRRRGRTPTTAFRTILFTDIVGSTDITQRLGDDKAMELAARARPRSCAAELAERRRQRGQAHRRRDHGVVRVGCPRASSARSRSSARSTSTRAMAEHPIHVRIGVSAGEPVAEGDDLFGAAVQLAARACDHAAAGSILASTAVRELCVGKGFTFESRGAFELKGFDEPDPAARSDAGAESA